VCVRACERRGRIVEGLRSSAVPRTRAHYMTGCSGDTTRFCTFKFGFEEKLQVDAFRLAPSSAPIMSSLSAISSCSSFISRPRYALKYLSKGFARKCEHIVKLDTMAVVIVAGHHRWTTP
jgi:hypothetical protein